MNSFAYAGRAHDWARFLRVVSLLLSAVWMSNGLSAGRIVAAQTAETAEAPAQESAANDTAGEPSDSDEPAGTDDSGEENPDEGNSNEDKTQSNPEEKSPPKEEKEEAESTKKPSDEEQPADKDAEEENERPIEEEPVPIDDKTKEKHPPKKKEEPPKKTKCVIGATATLMEKQSEILFRARIDSGAKSCSLHVKEIKIEKEEEIMADNIGKVIRFQVINGKGKKHWLESKIASYVIIKTSNSRDRRYKVLLTFQWKHMEKKVLVTLNDRNSMEYPLLLGRNFLRGDFLVDVELDSDD
jgi:hypothetical protein